MPEEDYLELQASESEDIYDSGGETDFGQKTASSLREKGKKIIKDWVDKLKPEKMNTSSISPSEDSYFMGDDESSLRSETLFEEVEDGENIEDMKNKRFLKDLCQDKTFMRGGRPEIQLMMAGEEHSNIPNLSDEVEKDGNEGSKPTSQFLIPELIQMEGEELQFFVA